MSDLTTSLEEANFLTEVRDALAGIDASKIPDDTITQARDRVVEPLLNDIGTYTASDQTKFDNASIMWTAEMSFDAWMTFTRLRDREIEAFVDPKAYKEMLKSRTDKVLGVLDVQRPPDVPNQVVTVAHDGEKRAVDFDDDWEVETTDDEGSE